MFKPANRVPSGVKNTTQDRDRDMASLEFNQENFNYILSELIRLRRQRTLDLIKMIEQSEEIQQLYIQHTKDYSPLRLA